MKLKTEKIKDSRGNVFTVKSMRVKNGVIFSTTDSFGKVVDAGKYKTKSTVMKHAREFYGG